MSFLVSSQELTLLYTFQGCLNQLKTLWADQRLPRDEAEGMMDHKWRRGDGYPDSGGGYTCVHTH